MANAHGGAGYPIEELRPQEIAARSFSRAVLGLNPQEVREFLHELATALSRTISDLNRAIQQRNELEQSLSEAMARAEELERDRAATQEKLVSYQELETRIHRVIVDAERAADEITRTAQANAAEAVAAADRTAAETIRSARESAAQILRAARTLAEETIRASEKAAAERLAQARMEADWVAEQGRQAATDTRAQAEAFVSGWHDISRRLEPLVEGYAGALQAMKELQTGLREVLRSATQKLEGSAGHPPPEAARTDLEEPPRDERLLRPAAAARSQIIVRPVRSYLRLTEFLTSLSRLKGVRTARVAAFSKSTATIDVALEGASLADLEIDRLKTFAVDVVEITPTRMVLRMPDDNGQEHGPG